MGIFCYDPNVQCSFVVLLFIVNSKQVFSAYTNNNPVFAAAVCHPASIVEAASLAVSSSLPRGHLVPLTHLQLQLSSLAQDVPLPPASYSLRESIPESLIASGKLSNLQLEGILYAVSAQCCTYCDVMRRKVLEAQEKKQV